MIEKAIPKHGVWSSMWEVAALLALFFVYAGDPAPAVNEAHYLVKAKNFWDPSYCSNDLFASSGKAHTTFYWTFGWLTQFVSLQATAWIGRVAGWGLIAWGLQRCCRALSLPTFSCVVVAVLWIVGIEQGNLAGEWVIGGIEAKVPAYGFVLIGLSEMIRRKWSRVWIWFGAGAAFHVLTGGWAVVAGAFSYFVTERVFKESDSPTPLFSKGLFVGGALSLFGLIPALWLTMGASAEDSASAARIYSFVRIRHHLLPSDFPAWWFVRHGTLVVSLLAAMVLVRRETFDRRVFSFAAGAALIAGIGLAVGSFAEQSPDLVAKLLRYYWFRLTDAMVPLALSMLICKFMLAPSSTRWNAGRFVSGTLFVGAAFFFVSSFVERSRLSVPPSASHRLVGFRLDDTPPSQRQSFADWISVCHWIDVAMPSDEVFLTPRHQQTFKWYSGRAEVVNWKDVPQDATSLLEWERRFYEVYPQHLGRSRVTINYQTLRQFREAYTVRFMVVDNRIAGPQLPLVKLYPSGEQVNATYSVYELPND